MTIWSSYQIPEAARALEDFVDDMSNWYVRRSRERFWAKGMEQDKINAYMTLYTALVTVCKAAAPMIPFMTEDIYQNLVRTDRSDGTGEHPSVRFPEGRCSAWIDKKLEENMDEVLKIVVMGRACRNAAQHQEPSADRSDVCKGSIIRCLSIFADIVKDELNVKKVNFTDDVRDFTSYTFKPQLKTVGPKYGKLLGRYPARHWRDWTAMRQWMN